MDGQTDHPINGNFFIFQFLDDIHKQTVVGDVLRQKEVAKSEDRFFFPL